MKEIRVFNFFAFGYNYKTLRFDCEGRAANGAGDTLASLIDEFFQYLNDLDLKVTNNAAGALRDIRTKLDRLPPESAVDASLAQELFKACDRLDTTLDAELQLRAAYIVTPKRFDLDLLLKSPAGLFAPNVFQALPTLCSYDLTEGCRCIAFGRPTAAAFHLLRATEAMLRHYYCQVVRRKRVRMLMWNDMVQHLRTRRDAPPKALLDHLDNIRVNFRNPTQHPEMRFDIEEAQDLLAVVVDAVGRMARGLQSKAA